MTESNGRPETPAEPHVNPWSSEALAARLPQPPQRPDTNGTRPPDPEGDAHASSEVEGMLPGMPAPRLPDPEAQWLLERLEVINWGTFDGRHIATFHPVSTLISGASGTGKSTLLDAYTALMMPSKVPFNGASNDAGTGRARDEAGGQRTLLTYLRGKVGNTDEGGGEKKATLLRGVGIPTWSAVAAVFVSSTGEVFTALRVFYVPASVSDDASVPKHMLTFDGRLSLEALEPAMSTFLPSMQLGKVLTSAVPGLRRHDSYDGFSSTLFKRLAIGGNGDGEKALELLARIQASKTVKSVTDLYRQLVLDTPDTFVHADRAIADFDNLADVYAQMETESDKAEVLRGIDDIHARLTTARKDADDLDTFGLTRPDASPITLWSLATERALLDVEVDRVNAARETSRELVRVATAEVARIKGLLASTKEAYDEAGGGELKSLEADIDQAKAVVENREDAAARLANQTTILGEPIRTRAVFEEHKTAAATFEVEQEDWKKQLATEQKRLILEQGPLGIRKGEIRSELESLANRKGRIPKLLNDLRADVARAAGLTPEDLPFLAELIDVKPEQSAWRLAIETVLGGDARRMLVPAHGFSAFSRAIDRLKLTGRITFVAAQPDLTELHPLDEDLAENRVAGKLEYAEHPYAGWIQRRLARPGRNALCVTDAADLDGDGFRVTMAGQIRNGVEGAHGRAAGAGFVIGFSNESLIADLEAEFDQLEAELLRLDGELAKLAVNDQLRTRFQQAYTALGQYTWDQIDVAGAQGQVEELVARRDRILAADNQLNELAAEVTRLEGLYDDASATRGAEEKTLKALDAEHLTLCEKQDECTDELERLEESQEVVLTPEQAERLDVEFAKVLGDGVASTHRDWPANQNRLRTHLQQASRDAQAEIERSGNELLRIFATYQKRWEDPNLAVDLDAYGDFKRILDEIESTGLYRRKEAWKRQLTEWSGEDLVPLANALRNGVANIKARIAPINDILEELPFGNRGGRLQIQVAATNVDVVVKFMRQLRQLSGTATREMSEEQLLRTFRDLRGFIDQLRPTSDPKLLDKDKSDRQRLLDIRRHVTISAIEHPAPGSGQTWAPREYTTLGETSGGETQELVAFIIGTALRFRLGDQSRSRPRFAPVFLDEGFVKADAQFAGRAVSAWKGLGFQIIVGTPEDKVTGLERHMGQLLAITKDPVANYSYMHPVTDAPGVEQAPATEDAAEDANGVRVAAPGVHPAWEAR